VPKGLFPGRGAAGRGIGGRGVGIPLEGGVGVTIVGVDGPTEGGGVGRTGLASAAAFCALACSAKSGEISASNSTAASGVRVSFTGAATAFLLTDFFTAAFLTLFLSSAGFASGKSSSILRTTGASTVDDGDLTNSPISWSFARTTLLSIPSCFANSCTRTFATVLLSWPAISSVASPSCQTS
jgi:hypothetical protein